MSRILNMTRRLSLPLIAVQVSMFLFMIVIGIVVTERDNLLVAAGVDLGNILLLDAVEKQPDGTLTLRPDEPLLQFRQRNPQMWFAVTDGKNTLVGGENAAGAPENLREIGDALAKASRLVGKDRVELRSTEIGELAVVGGGASASWHDLGTILSYMAVTIGPLVVGPVAIGTLLATLFVARRSLRSLGVAAEAAAKIDADHSGVRLPTRGTLQELKPLVSAFNSALDRLDEGFARQRRFVADAAHELRTPVAVLRLRLDALPEGHLKNELLADARRLSDLATGLLQLERLRGARLVDAPLDLVLLARDVAAERGPLAIESGYDIEVQAEAPSVRALGDAWTLRRALANLVDNAIVHGGGKGLITVRIARDGAISVSDQGAGVPPEEAERIFEPFHRVQAANSGAGLGLAMVRETMSAHGGRIRLVPPGEEGGAMFRLELPPHRLLQQAA